MKRTKKRILSLLLALLMVIAPAFILAPATEAYASVAHSQAEAVAWARARANEGWDLDVDHYAGCQCVDLIIAYYDYLGVRRSSGNARDYATNALPAGWVRVYSNPQPGDIIVWGPGAALQNGGYNANSTYGHIGIITGIVSSTQVSTVETNTYNHVAAKEFSARYSSTAACFIRPDFTAQPVQASWEGPTATKITETNAYLSGKVNFSQTLTTTQCGVRLYDSNGTRIAYKDEYVNYKYSYVNMWYDITSELGVTLTSGKSYTFQFYTVSSGKEYWSPIIKFTTAHTHSYTAKVTAPTCTEKGYTTHTCACGHRYIDSYVNAVGHSWNNGVVTKPATETATGIRTYTCTRCNATKTEVIPKLTHAHVYTATVTAPTCTEKGYTTHTCACGDSYIDSYVDALGHSWDNGVITKQPTEKDSGIKTFTCTRCGETKTETIPALGHTHSYTATVTKPTCTEKGYTTHTCSCGDSYIDSYVDALGHNYKDGVCTVCGEKDPTFNPFDDVSIKLADGRDNPYYTAILWAVEKEITNGVDSKHFAPDNTCTRAQVVTFLWRAAGSPEPKSANNPFVDVAAKQANGKDNPFYTAILWAVGEGITLGYDETHFAPDSSVTRAQFVTFLWRYENKPEAKPGVKLTDLNTVTNAEFKAAILWAAGEGITTGYADGSFRPNAVCTRAHVVTFIYRDMK